MNDDKPTPLQDVRKGLGLLFRAARSAVERLPKGGVEEVVVTSAREVGRAIENVASAIEREVFGRKGGPSQPPREGGQAPQDLPNEEAKHGGPKSPDTRA
ncbi:MAG: hypothetical protein M3O46_05640 [Myxococcota bacterium]|nr:hypothetical protein [Myxococcota bacterium]